MLEGGPWSIPFVWKPERFLVCLLKVWVTFFLKKPVSLKVGEEVLCWLYFSRCLSGIWHFFQQSSCLFLFHHTTHAASTCWLSNLFAFFSPVFIQHKITEIYWNLTHAFACHLYLHCAPPQSPLWYCPLSWIYSSSKISVSYQLSNCC